MHFSLNTLGAWLPVRAQHWVRARRFANQIRRGRLGRHRPDLALMTSLIKPGDCVLDIGANIGEYTHWFSQQVGKSGRVIAVEPVRETFALLAGNLTHFKFDNVTLINAAATDNSTTLHLAAPTMASGLTNYYQASISESGGEFTALGLVLDGLALPSRVAVIKIDAEGHDAQALRGLTHTVERDRPVLLLEQVDPAIAEWLATLGYVAQKVEGSANTLLECR